MKKQWKKAKAVFTVIKQDRELKTGETVTGNKN